LPLPFQATPAGGSSRRCGSSRCTILGRACEVRASMGDAFARTATDGRGWDRTSSYSPRRALFLHGGWPRASGSRATEMQGSIGSCGADPRGRNLTYRRSHQTALAPRRRACREVLTCLSGIRMVKEIIQLYDNRRQHESQVVRASARRLADHDTAPRLHRASRQRSATLTTPLVGRVVRAARSAFSPVPVRGLSTGRRRNHRDAKRAFTQREEFACQPRTS